MTRWVRQSDGSFIPDRSVLNKISPLHSALLDAIEDFHISSYNAFVLDILVTPHRRCNYRFNFEFSWSNSRDRCLGIRIPRNSEIVEVRLHQRWIPLTVYLNAEANRDLTNPNVVDHVDPFTARRLQYEHQQAWWAANKKVFPFMELPLELRERIYHFCTPGEVIEPYAQHYLRKYALTRTNYKNNIISGLLNSHPQISHEMRGYMFRTLPMKLNHHRLLDRTFLQNPHFPKHELTQLTFSLPGHSDYFHFFGLQARDPNTGYWVNELPLTSAKALGKHHLPCLKKLEIVVPHMDTLEDEGFLARGCQTKTTEMWLRNMWHFVQGQPLLLSGMVNKSTKQRWEEKGKKGVLAWQRQFQDRETGGVLIDKDTEEEVEEWMEEVIQKREEEDPDDEWDAEECAEERLRLGLPEWHEDSLGEIERLPVMELPPTCGCDRVCGSGEWSEV